MHIEIGISDVGPKSNSVAELLRKPLGEAALSTHLHQMEAMGSTWIALMPLAQMTQAIYDHLKEEMNHAQMLLRVATNLRNQLSPSAASLFNAVSVKSFAATTRYLRGLSLEVLKITADQRDKLGESRWLANYYGLSYLLERRVMKIYPSVAFHAKDIDLAETAKRILFEERGHLQHVVKGCEPFVSAGLFDLGALGDMDDEIYAALQAQLGKVL